MDHFEMLRTGRAQVTAEVTMIPTEEGGRRIPALPGFVCPVLLGMEQPLLTYSAWLLLGETPIKPGDVRTVGFVFANPDAIDLFRAADEFYLWEGRVIGHARAISDEQEAESYDIGTT